MLRSGVRLPIMLQASSSKRRASPHQSDRSAGVISVFDLFKIGLGPSSSESPIGRGITAETHRISSDAEASPHVTVFDTSARQNGTFSRHDFAHEGPRACGDSCGLALQPTHCQGWRRCWLRSGAIYPCDGWPSHWTNQGNACAQIERQLCGRTP